MNKFKILTLMFTLSITVFILIIPTQTYAKVTLDSVISGGDTFIDRGRNGVDSNGKKIETFDDEKFEGNIKSIFKFVYTIGIILSVIISAILGIQIMLASPEEKAEIKEKLIPYIIGCIVTFGAFSIWAIVMNLAGSIQ